MRYNGKRWQYKCEEAGCASEPSQGLKGEHFPRFCRNHRRRGCIRMKKQSQCSHDGCRKQPSYATPGTKAARCRRHALDGEINVKCKQCRFGGCSTQAHYGVGDKKDWCKKHAPPGSTAKVSVKRVCRAPGCTTRASFGTEWQKPKHCAQHATDDEDNCMVRRCLAPLDGGGECLTQPVFGPPGGRKLRCAAHREPGHVNLVSRRCAHDRCDKQPSFGTKATGALFCGRHRRVGDTNVKDKMCSAAGCEKRPSFGTKASGALFCGRHKRAGDTNVKDKKCSTAGCEKPPTYGPAPEAENGPRKKLRCATHAIASDVQNKDKGRAGFGRPAPRFRGGQCKLARKRAANEVYLGCSCLNVDQLLLV